MMSKGPNRFEEFFRPLYDGLRYRLRFGAHTRNFARLTRQVAENSPTPEGARPVLFFQASSGLKYLSLNIAFHYLTAWSLRLKGVPVVHLVCQRGLQPCVLGTRRDNPSHKPPCTDCMAFSRALTRKGQVQPLTYQQNNELSARLDGLSLAELGAFETAITLGARQVSMPLGALCLPGLRWIMRRHTLVDDQNIRTLLRGYMLSAWNLAQVASRLIQQLDPRAVVVFNGQFYPEATLRWVSRQYNLRSVTHEVGMLPFTAFFTEGEATAYPVAIPPEFELSAEQNARLDAYLEQRLKGQFSMAGIRFWPEMRGLDEAFLQKASAFKQIVPVFTNVVFDTSQPHANTVFPEMFAWLDEVLKIAHAHLETLFVIRAHPDEDRPGKAAQESVAMWAEKNHITELENVVFIPPKEYLSSYELIQRSKFVMIYNSTIGLEASIMGAAVLCAGRARFTQYETVFFPRSVPAFQQQAQEFLAAPKVQVPAEHRHQARRFLYFQLYRTALPFDTFMAAGRKAGVAALKPFDWQALLPENSPVMRVLHAGILNGKPFILEE
jgi:hypothetical protein